MSCCPTLWCWLKWCMKQNTASLSGTHTSFCPRFSVCHMSSDLPMQFQPSKTRILTDPESGWKGSPSELGMMRVASSRFEVLQQRFLPHSPLVGSSNPSYSLLLSAAQLNFEAFWILCVKIIFLAMIICLSLSLILVLKFFLRVKLCLQSLGSLFGLFSPIWTILLSIFSPSSHPVQFL